MPATKLLKCSVSFARFSTPLFACSVILERFSWYALPPSSSVFCRLLYLFCSSMTFETAFSSCVLSMLSERVIRCISTFAFSSALKSLSDSLRICSVVPANEKPFPRSLYLFCNSATICPTSFVTFFCLFADGLHGPCYFRAHILYFRR